MDLGLGSILSLALSTGLVTAFFNLGFGLYRDERTRKQKRTEDATYLAMRLAVILEAFTIACVERSWHDEADMRERMTETSNALPALLPYLDITDWKSLDPVLAGRALSLANEIRLAEASDTFSSMREGNRVSSLGQAAVVGGNAWKLAEDLRERYDLGSLRISTVGQNAIDRMVRDGLTIARRS